MQRPGLQYLVGMLPNETRKSITETLKCGKSVRDLTDMIVNDPVALEAISKTFLTNHDVFWQFLIEASYPSFYECAKSIELPTPENSDLRPTSAWMDLYHELFALHRDEDARRALDLALLWADELEVEALTSYELVTHALCQRELAFTGELLFVTPVVSGCIQLASPVCLGLPLDKHQMSKLFLSSLRQGKVAITRALAEDPRFRYVLPAPLDDYSKARDIFMAAARSTREETMELVLKYIPPKYDISSMLNLLIGRELLDILTHPVGVIRALIEDGRADVGIQNNFLVIWASRRRETELVSRLLSDTRVHPFAKEGVALVGAASSGHKEMVQLLLSDGRGTDRMKHLAVAAAVMSDSLSVVQLFLTSDTVHPYDILGICCLHGRDAIIEEILTELATRRAPLAPSGPWMHNLFLWASEPHPSCARRVISALSLDLKKEEHILVNLAQGFDTMKIEAPNREKAMRCLLDELQVVTHAEYTATLLIVCNLGYSGVAGVLLGYGNSMGFLIPESTLDECMVAAIDREDLNTSRALLLAVAPSPRAHGRWITRASQSSHQELVELFLSHHKGGTLLEATASCVVSLANNDISILTTFMDCADFDTSAENSLLLRTVLPQGNSEALKLVLADANASAGLDDKGVKDFLARIFELGDRDLMNLALAQHGARKENSGRRL